MEITINNVIGLNKVLNLFINKELPIKTAFKLNRLLLEIEKELILAEKLRVNLFKRYAETDKADGQEKIPSEKEASYMQEFNEILDTKININFEPISLEELGNIEEMKLSIVEMRFLNLILQNV